MNFVDASFPFYCLGEMGKRKEISTSWFSLTQLTSPLSGFIQNLKTLALIAGETLCLIFMRKKKWKNKGNDKNEDAHSLLYNTTSHIKCLYQISKS